MVLPTAGQLIHQVDLQQPTRPSADSFGQRQPAFATVATVYALVEQVSGQELTQTQLQRETVSYKVSIRYYPGLDSTWQVVWNGATINLQSATNPDGKKIWHLLTGRSFTQGDA